ncbi:glycerol-3-phosphate dehydrogenase/oxidase [Homoserinibacter gongjuensis]|jgi:glycerol-3-phosphate dehydrogenase|uniref:FAD-dependent oxidoreductase n=1 Tax=Homoserinibacter gongjuensis TaxID=1162968 RepID=A0ABQ6JSE3_9MICO|nr:glycerol-3-phosphate dehydrogenase/oxidase [Homoserinibacter gongjuensis]GMA91227.1 FAD-dependent oxidoreductase [Homoserinibacter gongjuensis]
MAELSPAGRQAALAAMREQQLDVLVVGGGIVGAGTALEAVTRGLSTGIVEARDWGSGTSSRSSKLVHGGIRYLEQLDFRLVREALIERGLLLQRIAPHLVKPVKFLYPVTVPLVERAYIGAGMTLYDLFSWTGGREPGVPHHRHLTKRQLAKAAPDLRPDAFRGGLVYYDAQVDDARYVASLVRTAAEYGAHAANRVKVEGLLREGARVVGVEAVDRETGERLEIRAREVVSATGVWTDELQAMAGVRPFRVRASKGVHLVVPRDRIRGTLGLLLRTEKSVLFLIPWGRHWLIGTTDTDWELDLAHPAATAADIDYLLAHINSVLATPLTRDDVEGVYAGLRPLLAGESDETSKLSREHIVATPVPGFVSVAGGKLTTYRVMAKDTVDAVARGIERPTPPSVTEHIGLTGAEGYPAAWNRRGRIARKHGLTPGAVGHLLNRFGTHAREVLALIDARPELGALLPGSEDYLAAEVVYAVTHEGALHLDDVLARRTRMSIEAWDRGVSAAPVAARLMGEVLGWDDARVDLEVSRYLERVEAERASQLEPDDASADRVRLAAREV